MTHRSSGHLVVVTTSFPIARDGSEAAGSFVADFVDCLATYGTVHVVAPGPEARIEDWSANVRVHRFASPPYALSLLKPWKLRDWPWILRTWHGGKAATREASSGARHIIALWGLPSGEWARAIAAERGIQFSTWVLGSDVWSLGRIPVLRAMLARVLRRSKKRYADGYKLARDASVIAEAPVEFLPSTRSIEPNADFARVRAAAPYRILFIGRWHENKGIDLLLDALGLLTDADWEKIELVRIFGGGPLEALVRAKSSQLAAEARPVEIGDYVDKAQAIVAFQQSDWLIIPSRIESIPVVFSDAMKMSRPVIATPVGDLQRLLGHDLAGICASSATAEAISEALRVAISSTTDDFLPGVAAVAHRFDMEMSVVKPLLDGMEEGGLADG